MRRERVTQGKGIPLSISYSMGHQSVIVVINNLNADVALGLADEIKVVVWGFHKAWDG